ncbi:HicA-like toxin [Gordonia phage Pleakley]|uniref:HicA-like toxin n=1 Tax=Gordonia phage Pleakley TaxID=2283246 RepID=A0A345M6C9_9CAUD|nr:HicA-like toxin [Gordonia phage Pleakley]AXH49737.1 HicA-like toxin [Gordonia phage Fury]AXH66050.1 HicA-like toxin [Gordonia phage Pleakley]
MTLMPSSPGSKKGLSRLGRGGTKEYRDLVRKIEAAGGEVRKPTGKGHPKVYLGGRFIMTLCCTPSDHRSRKNELARLRRAGLEIS